MFTLEIGNLTLASPSDEQDTQLTQHLNLLKELPNQHRGLSEVTTTPIFTIPVLEHVNNILPPGNPDPVPQYGLIGGFSEVLEQREALGKATTEQDPRVFFNVATPSSTFICGSQGSGKSHTLACILENCLSLSVAGQLPKPLTGMVFHYDTFISDDGGSPCEAAYLSSNPNIKVRVLCSPTNIRSIEKTYQRLQVQIQPLQIHESDLNTKRILELMVVKTDEAILLYVHTIYRILREMRIEQQNARSKFDYGEFKRQLEKSGLTAAQIGPLNQRLDTLESFMTSDLTSQGHAHGKVKKGKNHQILKKGGIEWETEPGSLTIVDLSCPCMTPESACSLFNICLGLFIEQSMNAGRVIALDEAHKYMNSSIEATTLTETLLSTIRLQRHLGARIIISTQEPTISTALLDLCSVTIAHRFTSPEWLNCLKGHLAAASANSIQQGKKSDITESHVRTGDAASLFQEIVRLHVGEALIFAPSAILQLVVDEKGVTDLKRLGAAYVKMRIRNRLTTDGGGSVMAI